MTLVWEMNRCSILNKHANMWKVNNVFTLQSRRRYRSLFLVRSLSHPSSLPWLLLSCVSISKRQTRMRTSWFLKLWISVYKSESDRNTAKSLEIARYAARRRVDCSQCGRGRKFLRQKDERKRISLPKTLNGQRYPCPAFLVFLEGGQSSTTGKGWTPVQEGQKLKRSKSLPPPQLFGLL